MSDRVRFLKNPTAPQQILLIDLRGFGAPADAMEFIAEARDLIASQPRHSVRCMVDVENARFNTDVVEALKELAAHNRPFVIASAIVGVTGLQRIILEAVVKFTGRTNFKAVPSRDAAFEWLATQHAPTS